MFKKQKLPLAVVSFFAYLVIAFTFSGVVTQAFGQEAVRTVPSLGKGSYEVIMFADYFCPPCGQIDSKAEPLLKELLATGKVKITFVDVPFARATPTFAKYYLYAVNAGADNQEIFRVRKALFDAAQVKKIQMKDDLVNYLKKEKITWKEFDEQPVLKVMNQMITENKVTQTPTCVIKYSPTDVKNYVGKDDIWTGLTQLKTRLTTEKKKKR